MSINLHVVVPATAEHNHLIGYLSLYKMGPKIYRAGVSLAAPPVKLPSNLTYRKFAGGKYVNDPRRTPEDQLITQILVPTS